MYTCIFAMPYTEGVSAKRSGFRESREVVEERKARRMATTKKKTRGSGRHESGDMPVKPSHEANTNAARTAKRLVPGSCRSRGLFGVCQSSCKPLPPKSATQGFIGIWRGSAAAEAIARKQKKAPGGQSDGGEQCCSAGTCMTGQWPRGAVPSPASPCKPSEN